MITKREIEHIAALGKLEFSEEEKSDMVKTLGGMLDYISILDNVDTGSIEPILHISPLKNVLRDDVAEPSLNRERVLENAPDTAKGCFRVPRVI